MLVNALYKTLPYLFDMNTGFLSNPAPSQGYNSVMAALAPRNAPESGTLGGTKPSVHNNVKETFVNPVATYPFLVNRWREGYEQSFHEGDLMFICVGHSKSTRKVTLANLPLLNQLMLTGDDEMLRERHKWKFLGIMRNSAVATGYSRQVATSRGGNRLPAERIINIDVRGASRVFNYWPDAQPGYHIHLAWQIQTKGERVPDYPVMNSKDAEHVNTDTNKKEVWQLMPVSRNMIHDTQFKTTNKLFVNTTLLPPEGYSAPIKVGFVHQIGNKQVTDGMAQEKATQFNADRFKLPLIDVFVRI